MQNLEPIDLQQAAVPGLLRRLAAIVYDGLLLAAMFTLGAAVIVLPAGLIFDIPEPATDPWVTLLLRIALVLLSFGFFAGFWLRGGQTLGMRAWRIRVIRSDGLPLTFGYALKRFLFALLSWASLGLGFLWMLVDREHLTWHDRLSGTRLVLLSKPDRQSRQ